MRKLISSLLVVALVYATLLIWPTNNRVADIPFYADNSFNIIAHGNGRALQPGNTLEAAANALSVGTDILELDVHLTADNILVVRHDETIDSTTNGSGRIADMTLAELSWFDVGFNEYDYPGKVAEKGIRIPTLESLFVAFPTNRFLIEIKPEVSTKTPTIRHAQTHTNTQAHTQDNKQRKTHMCAYVYQRFKRSGAFCFLPLPQLLPSCDGLHIACKGANPVFGLGHCHRQQTRVPDRVTAWKPETSVLNSDGWRGVPPSAGVLA